MIDTIFIAIAAFTLTEILTEPGMILNWLYLRICKLPAWLNKPLISCSYCVAGQWSLWLYLVLYWPEYNLLHHIAYVTTSIFFVHVFISLNYKLNGTD